MAKVKYLSADELERLFSAIESTRDRAIFRVAYHRGLRVREVGLIQMEDFNQERTRLFVHRLKGRRAETDTSGEYTLLNTEARALRAWLKERGDSSGPIFTSNRKTAISQQMLDVLMKRYCADAGIARDKAHFHALRHSCATSMLERGRELVEIKDHLGHRSIASTDIYAKITNKHRDRIAAELMGWE